MKASELRIGNYVKVTKKGGYNNIDDTITVDCINYQGVNKWSDMGANGVNTFDGIEGVPITDEWLTRFGFEKIGQNFRKIEDHGYGLGMTEFVVWFNTAKKTYSIKAINILIEIETVHRLQNIYLDLMTKELSLS